MTKHTAAVHAQIVQRVRHPMFTQIGGGGADDELQGKQAAGIMTHSIESYFTAKAQPKIQSGLGCVLKVMKRCCCSNQPTSHDFPSLL
ncbi:hypothetical protein [Aeromonas dhakensis]